MGERKIHESFPQGRHPIKVFNKEDEDETNSGTQKTVSPRRLKVRTIIFNLNEINQRIIYLFIY